MATIKLKFRPSSVKGKDGTLLFQIIHKRQVKQIYTGLHINDAEWNAGESDIIITPEASPGKRMALSAIKDAVQKCRQKLLAIISEFEHKGGAYTVQDVVMAYNAPITIEGLVSFARRLIEDMKKIGKKSSVKRLSTTINSLLRYTGGMDVAWTEISSTFIIGFEEFLMRRGLCRNSTSFYMRNLRSIVNRAIEEGFEVIHNPFKHVYMGVDKTVKRAVSLDVVRMIRDLNLSGRPALDFARKVFMFAFFTRGMSFVDIAFLKKSNLHNGVITYSRRKTRQQLMIRIEPELKKIIDSFGKNATPYLLPIINDESGNQERQYENAYCRVNRNIQKVGEMLGLNTKLTLYVARHAWASIAHSNNVSLSTISKAMGHESEKTTIIYLQSLDSSSVDKANSDIIRMMNRRKGLR